MTALLTAQSLEVRYGQNLAVRGVSMQVKKGAITTVIGANGAGKTSLLAGLMGLERRSGSIVFDGCDASHSAPEQNVRRGMILVPERRELFGSMSVNDNLILGGVADRRRPKPALDERLAGVFNKYPRLAERRNQLAGTLSGGERQMLALGRALMGNPRLLLLDEPSLGLAPNLVAQMFDWICALRDDGISILLIEQNALAALDVAQYAYVMSQGEFTTEGEAAKLRDQDEIVSRYFGKKEMSRKAGEAKS
ncbi:MAG: ABC transporter ATP-binding protein [Pseudorhodoplanes sp.]